ncbi:hypothetical protein ACHAQJ_001510 [Trichoderma viride]
MDPDLLDRQIDDLLAGTTNGSLPTALDSWFEEYETWLETVPAAADPPPAANISDEDEVMEDAGVFPGAPPSDSNDDSVTDKESLISEFFGPGVLRDSSLDEAMASLDLVGIDGPDTEAEFLAAALAQLDITSVEDIIIEEQQLSREDVDMVELQKLIPPVLVIDMAEPEEPIPPTVDDIVPDAIPDSPQQGASSPRSPYMGEDDEDWDEPEPIDLEAMFDFMLERTPPRTPTRAKSTSESEDELSSDGSPSLVRSPGSSLADDLEAAFLSATPPRSLSRSPSPDLDEAPLWAFPPEMVDNSGGVATNLSLNELFNFRQTIEGNPTTESAADDLSEEDPAPTDSVSGPDSVTEAQEPAPEDHTQAGSSESPDEDATLASGAVVAEEQQPVTQTPVPVTIPTIIVTPEPNRMKQVEVAPIRMGGLILPGGNLVLPATPAPMTPLPQQVKTPDAEALRKKKEESLARDLRNVMRRRQPASIFHPKLPQKSSALIRSPEAAERESLLRSPQSFHALSRAGSDADGGVDAVDEGAAKVMLASPAVMKAIRDSEAQRGILREGNADER